MINIGNKNNVEVHGQDKVLVMGIINVNEESFYAASRCTGIDSFEARMEEMLAAGADIIDIGACSTKPGSTPVSEEKEWENLRGVLKWFLNNGIAIGEGRGFMGGLKISVDTFRAEIVRRVYDEIGAFIVNDISAGEDDCAMLERVGELKLPYIAMHKRGTPDTMQSMCDYQDGVVNEVINYFNSFSDKAKSYNINSYMIDPGFGFAKTVEQNYELLNGMQRIIGEVERYSGSYRPLLAGLSRKSMIWKPLGITPDEALSATVALNLQCLLNGAEVIRVHDVKEGVQTRTLFNLIVNGTVQ
jgi:dihydropteroate synthase